MLLLLKARIPGDTTGDLFSQPVVVAGHMRGATFVQPYTATRKLAPTPPPAAAKPPAGPDPMQAVLTRIAAELRSGAAAFPAINFAPRHLAELRRRGWISPDTGERRFGVEVAPFTLTEAGRTEVFRAVARANEARRPPEPATPPAAGRTIAHDELPPDIAELVGAFISGPDDDEHYLPPTTLPLVTLDMARMPETAFDAGSDDRGAAYAMAMGRDVPPIIVADGHVLDGRHRLYAARQRGDATIDAIDLSGLAHPTSLAADSLGTIQPPAPTAPPVTPPAAGAAPSLLPRPTRPDGRLIPQEGDEVFQTVAGPFGMPGVLHGTVRGGRVHITGTASLIAGSTSRKTDTLTDHWIVRGDPEIARRAAAREAAEVARKAADQAERAAEEARITAAAAARGTLDPATVRLGDVIEDPDGVPHLVAEIHGADLYGHPLDDAEAHRGGLGGDYRGWRATDLQAPEGSIVVAYDPPDSLALSDQRVRQRQGGAWVPVRYDDDAGTYAADAAASAAQWSANFATRS